MYPQRHGGLGELPERYGGLGGLGQPALDPYVLAFQVSPQQSSSFQPWLDYWLAQIDEAGDAQAVQRVIAAAVDDLIAQGASDELVTFARDGIFQSAYNVRVQNLDAGTSYQLAPTDARTAANLDVWRRRYLEVLDSIAYFEAMPVVDRAAVRELELEAGELASMLGPDNVPTAPLPPPELLRVATPPAENLEDIYQGQQEAYDEWGAPEPGAPVQGAPGPAVASPPVYVPPPVTYTPEPVVPIETIGGELEPEPLEAGIHLSPIGWLAVGGILFAVLRGKRPRH